MAEQARETAGERTQQALVARATGATFNSSQADPVSRPLTTALGTVQPGLNFEAQTANDTFAAIGTKYVPPDTNGAAGATQFVQMVNVTIAVYSKKTGARVLGPVAIHTLWTGFGGPCENGGDGGDPVVLYDQLAGRWFISQLQFNSNFSSNQECIAVSTSSDATGSYNRYQFDFGSTLPDYPKFAVWPDAYYSSQNLFAPSGGRLTFAGALACALDRSAMLAGSGATRICFNNAGASSLLPSNLDGSTLPPAGSPNYFVDLATSSSLSLFRFHTDFSNPANATFTGPVAIAVAPFSQICPFAINAACIQEPPPGERLDSLDDRLMFRLAYRNFGDHESLVTNHTIKTGPAIAGVRWYEIRNPGTAPTVFQQGTVTDGSTNFWMGSIGMDRAGNIAVGFSAASLDVAPSVLVAGRLATDAPGTMSGPFVIVNGTGVQQHSFNRWGDYSAISIDPADDCTFWYTQEYYETTGSFNWTTRVGAFKFSSCSARGK